MSAKLLLLHGPAGSGKATLIRYLAMRMGDAGPTLAKHDGVLFTVWKDAGIVALGDYLSCTPPGADKIPLRRAWAALSELARKRGAKLPIAEGLPLSVPPMLRKLRKLGARHFRVDTHPWSRGSRCMRKHETLKTTTADRAAEKFTRALVASGQRYIRLTTASPVATEAAIQLLASTAGLKLPVGQMPPVDSVTRTSRWNMYRSQHEAKKVAEAAGKAAPKKKESPRRGRPAKVRGARRAGRKSLAA